MSASASSGSKRGSRMTDAPTRNAMFMTAVCPKVWKSGSPPKTTSSARRSNASMSVQCDLLDDRQVRPDGALGRAGRARRVEDRGGVERVRPGSCRSIGRATDASTSSRGRSTPASAGSSTVTSGTPVCAAAGSASPSRGAATTSRSAPESRRTKAISSALKSRWIGTTTAPSESAAKYTRAKSGTFGTSIATRSPRPMPRSRRAPA